MLYNFVNYFKVVFYLVSVLVRETEGKGVLKYNNKNYPVKGFQRNTDEQVRVVEATIGNNTLSVVTNFDFNRASGMDFIQSAHTGGIFLNKKQIGTMCYELMDGDGGGSSPDKVMHFNDSKTVEFFFVGIGDSYVFLYESGEVVGCAHQESAIVYTIFANNEWYTHLLAVYLSFDLLLKEPKFSTKVYSGQRSRRNKYNANYISNVLKSEPENIKKKYEHLIHSHIDSETFAENAFNKGLLWILLPICIMFGIFIIIMVLGALA